MRTTVDLPPDLHAVARALAHDQGRSLSTVIADLVRKGLSSGTPDVKARPRQRAGFPLLDLPRTITTEDVLAADEE